MPYLGGLLGFYLFVSFVVALYHMVFKTQDFVTSVKTAVSWPRDLTVAIKKMM